MKFNILAGFALCAQEVRTVKAASLFLCNVIIISREQDALLMVVQDHGAELVYLILNAIGMCKRSHFYLFSYIFLIRNILQAKFPRVIV